MNQTSGTVIAALVGQGMKRALTLVLLAVFVLSCSGRGAQPQSDPLPSWNDGPTKQRIIEFVQAVTDPSKSSFVPEPERIATFDNDGTLWASHPMYSQLAFALHRVKALASDHPEWAQQQPFKAILEDDREALGEFTEHDMMEIVMGTHAGMTTAEFEQIVTDWIATAKHPRFDRPYTEMVYQPMVELMAYLRANGFKTFIVSGGGIEFMRPWTEGVYGIPPEQVIGSSINTKFEMRDGKPVLVRLPEINFINDKDGKPKGINSHIGRRPILAFGNSDGDIEMLQYTTIGRRPSLGLLVHHDDAEREFAYDCDTKVGRLCKGLKLAKERGWILISMKNDWRRIFAFEK